MEVRFVVCVSPRDPSGAEGGEASREWRLFIIGMGELRDEMELSEKLITEKKRMGTRKKTIPVQEEPDESRRQRRWQNPRPDFSHFK